MEPANEQRHAVCSCGQLSLVAAGDPVRISVCHCHACQRRTGSVFGVQARFPRDQVLIQGSAKTYLRTADSGNRITCHFCPLCGGTLYLLLDQLPEHLVIPVGAFADQAFPPPTISIYETRRHPWTELPTVTEHLDESGGDRAGPRRVGPG